MTQAIYRFPEQNINNNSINKLEPFNIEAEEAVIGCILLHPNSLYIIKDTLKPEHFYVSAHRDIYRACIKLADKSKPSDLLTVTSWLQDHNILHRVGGRSRLVALVDRTVTNATIDYMAGLIIEKSVRRQMIKLGNEISELGYAVELELPEIIASIEERTKSIVPVNTNKEDNQRWRHDYLLKQLMDIYTTVEEPSLRFLKLHDLAYDQKLTMNFLEIFYLKSLTAQCSKLLSYEELKELAGSTVREWLVNGLVPKHTTICLVADGGAGKTKFAYGIAKVMIQGTRFGPFQATGSKRKILYYQGDESPGDMLQALEALGYSEADINKYVHVRFGWSTENTPALIKDLKEFQPDFVVIDSLTTANRYSIYQESQMEYARPILEMTGLASQYKTTFLIIHHSNKEGEVRGTTAIRNAVSEVWRLSLPKGVDVRPNDRILEINKSRSRSSGKKYQVSFNSEDLSFSFLGEEVDQESSADASAKQRILNFFIENRNIRFTSEEISFRLSLASGHSRRCLGVLASDGLISCERRTGKANHYFLAYEDSSPDEQQMITLSDHHPSKPETHTQEEKQATDNSGIKKMDHQMITLSDHLQNDATAINTAKGDQVIIENTPNKKIENQKISEPETKADDHLCSNALCSKSSGGDHGGDHSTNSPLADPDHGSPNGSPTQPQTSGNGFGLRTPSPFTVEVDSCHLGKSTATVTPVKIFKSKEMSIEIQYEFADGSQKTEKHKIKGSKKEATAIALGLLTQWRDQELINPSRRYTVQQLRGTEHDPKIVLLKNCLCSKVPSHPHNSFYIFVTSDDEIIRVGGDNEFWLEK